MKCITMILAKLQTSNFEFCAYGTTTTHAINALIQGLIQHGKQYGLDEDWFEPYKGEIFTLYIKLNCAYRDNEKIKVI